MGFYLRIVGDSQGCCHWKGVVRIRISKQLYILKMVYNFKNLLRFVQLRLYLCMLVTVDSITKLS